MKGSLTILISSGDAYMDVIDVWLRSFEKFAADCPYKVVIATDCKKVLRCGGSVKNVLSGDANNTLLPRAVWALENEIDSDYILFMIADCFFTQKVDWDAVEKIVDDMKQHQINYASMLPVCRRGKAIRNSVLCYAKQTNPYSLSLRMGIWQREFFTQKCAEVSDEWQLEYSECTKAAKEEHSEVYFTDIAVTGSKNMLHIAHSITGGRYIPSVLKKMKRLGITIDSGRGSLPYYEEIYAHLCETLLAYVPFPMLYRTGRKFGFFKDM